MIISKKQNTHSPACMFSSHMKDTVDEPTQAPTAITLNEEQLTKLNKSRPKDVVDEDDFNLTLINSTFNYTETQEVRMCHITLPDH